MVKKNVDSCSLNSWALQRDVLEYFLGCLLFYFTSLRTSFKIRTKRQTSVFYVLQRNIDSSSSVCSSLQLWLTRAQLFVWQSAVRNSKHLNSKAWNSRLWHELENAVLITCPWSVLSFFLNRFNQWSVTINYDTHFLLSFYNWWSQCILCWRRE